MKGFFLCIAVLFIEFSPALSQKQANIWYFGNRAGLDFSSGSPVALTDSKMETFEGCATLCDKKTGRLLFYTEGDTVWDSSHKIMPNGIGLGGNYSSTQSAIIVPKPETEGQYYIFTVDARAGKYTGSSGSGGMSLNLVDMSLNSGLGDVVTKSKLIVSPTCEKLTATPHCNGTDYWVLIHCWGTDSIYSYLLSKSGLSTTPVISRTGISMTGKVSDQAIQSIGYMKISPNGKKIALASYRNLHFLQIGDFDNQTGIASGFFNDSAFGSSFSVDGGPYGVAFSPDNSKLYLTVQGINSLFQYDLNAGSAPAVVASRVLVKKITSFLVGGIQLGPDGKIYVAKNSSPKLDVIKNPNLPGVACNYQTDGVQTGSLIKHYSEFGLPDFVESFVVPHHQAVLTYNSCEGDRDTVMVDSALADPVTVVWDFGDPASGADNTSTLPNPNHIFSSKGTYTVSVTVTHPCGSFTVRKTISTDGNFKVNAGADRLMCADEPIQLEATGGLNYKWSPSIGLSCMDCHDPTVTATVTTTYTVQISNGPDCFDEDEVVVTVLDKVIASVSPADTSICEGQSVQLVASGGTDYTWMPVNYLINSSGATPVATPQQSVTYKVVVGLGNCPKDSAFVSINVHPRPTVDAGQDITLYAGKSEQIKATASSAKTIVWTPAEGLDHPDILQPTATPVQTTQFTVLVTDDYGCTDSDSVLISVAQGQVYFPTAFSPNGDGVNDVFSFFSEGVKSVNLKIFNRWGEMIFQSDSPMKQWDGKFKNQYQSVGAYVYLAVVTQYDGKEIIYKGTVTLLR